MTQIRVELQLVDGSFVSGVLRAGQTLRSFRQELERVDPHFRKLSQSGRMFVDQARRIDTVNRGMLQTLRDISIVGGFAALAFSTMSGEAGGLIGKVLKVNAEIERLQYQMRGMSTANDPFAESARNVEYLRQMAQRVPFTLKELSGSFVKLKATGTDPAAGSLQALADGIAAFGGTDEQLHRVILGVTQMSGKAVIQMEEMRQQLGESMPNAIQIMARSMGITVARLTKIIATGQLEAKSSLDKFYKELDRAYGGAAQRMMQSFSGQVTQLNANLQILATEGQLKSFFDNQKSLLVEINDFLRSDKAKEYADALGLALQGLSNLLVGGARFVVQYREEFVSLAQLFAAGLGLKVVIGLFRQLQIALVTTKLAQLSFSADLRNGASMMALSATGMNSMATAGLSLRYAMLGAGYAIRGAATAAITFAPWIAVIGTAIYIAGKQFGLFGDQVGDAYENLVKFGAESKRQAEEVLGEREQQLLARIAELNNVIAGLELSNQGTIPDYQRKNNERNIAQVRQQLADVEKEYEKFLESRDGLIIASAKTERDTAVRAYERELSAKEEMAQSAYKERQVEIDRQNQEAESTATEQGKALREIDKENQDRIYQNRLRLSDEMLALYDDEIKKLEAAHQTADKTDKERIESMLAFVREKRIQEYNERKNLGDFGFKLLEAPEDQEKKLTKARNELARLTDDIAGLRSEIRGANGAYAAMLSAIERGDYGSIREGGEEVRKLHDELLAAAGAKEALDKVLKGQQQIERDIENARLKLAEQRADLQEKLRGEELTEAEKALIKLNEGGYFGLGPIERIRGDLTGLMRDMITGGEITNQLGDAFQKHAFGDETVQNIRTVRDEIETLIGSMTNLNGLVLGTSFAGMRSSGIRRNIPNFNGGIFDLIGAAEGTDKGRGYNETLDYGRWTGGDVELTKMTLRQILELQERMLANPANRALYGNGKGSSALGRYQIVSITLKDLIKEMGLTGDELFDERMQDAMAARLLARRGRDPNSLRQEWQGLNNISDEQIAAAFERDSLGPTKAKAAGLSGESTGGARFDVAANQAALEDMIKDRQKRTEEFRQELEVIRQQEIALGSTADALEQKKYLDTLIEKSRKASLEIEDLGENHAELIAAIERGDLGKNKDAGAPEYAKLIEAAKELDRVEKSIAEKKKAAKDYERESIDFQEKTLDIERQIEEQKKRSADPDYRMESDEIRRMTTELDAYVASAERAFGRDSAQYRRASEMRSQLLGGQRSLEMEERRADLEAEKRDIEDSLLTERQLRGVALQRKIREIDTFAEKMRAAGVEEVEIVRWTEEQKRAIYASHARDENPLIAQMQEWQDLSGNLLAASTRWTDSLASGIAGLVTGTGNLRSAINGIINDVVEIYIRKLFADRMGSKTVGAGNKLGSKGSKKLPVPIAHGGGMVGALRASKFVNPAVFAGARRFHTGGLVPGEVPIIARRGEGVFTPEQMKAMGGFGGGNVQINAPITVNASGGTPEQNADLAERMSREISTQMKATVAEELRRHMRPGGMLGK